MEEDENQVGQSLPGDEEDGTSDEAKDPLAGTENIESTEDGSLPVISKENEEVEEAAAERSNPEPENNEGAEVGQEGSPPSAMEEENMNQEKEPVEEDVSTEETMSAAPVDQNSAEAIPVPTEEEVPHPPSSDARLGEEEQTSAPEMTPTSQETVTQEENVSSNAEHLSSEIPLKTTVEGSNKSDRNSKGGTEGSVSEETQSAEAEDTGSQPPPTATLLQGSKDIATPTRSDADQARRAPVESSATSSSPAKTLVPIPPPPRGATLPPPTPTGEAALASASPTVNPTAPPPTGDTSAAVRKTTGVRQGSPVPRGSATQDRFSATRTTRGAASRSPVQERITSQDRSYDLSQRGESSGLVGQLLPAVFRRGADNSHINRMTQGSYSRYLMSCDAIPKNSFVRSFYGELPIPGFLPFRGERSSNADAQVPWKSPRWGSSRRERNNQPGRYPGDTLSTAVAGGLPGSMRREAGMLPEKYHNELRAQRFRRRRDPQHGVDPTLTDQYYYQQKSKAFYVPQEQNPNAAMLQYNHLYDFGDGSRFKSNEPPVRNPTALPPKTYGQQKAATKVSPYLPADRSSATLYEGQGDPMQKGSSSSLRTAKAVDAQKLHTSQFRQTRSIEDVIASDPNFVSRSAAGVRSAVASGKMDWSELPNRLQGVMSAERFKNGATPNSQKRNASEDGNVLPSIHPQHSQQQGDQYEVSRVNFTKRYEPHATPSAFVGAENGSL